MVGHHRLIRQLVAALIECRAENFYSYSNQERLEKKLRDANYDLQQVEKQRKDAEYRSWEREDAIKALEKANREGDQWHIDRAMKKLRNI